MPEGGCFKIVKKVVKGLTWANKQTTQARGKYCWLELQNVTVHGLCKRQLDTCLVSESSFKIEQKPVSDIIPS